MRSARESDEQIYAAVAHVVKCLVCFLFLLLYLKFSFHYYRWMLYVTLLIIINHRQVYYQVIKV
jgi:hypothetical protein